MKNKKVKATIVIAIVIIIIFGGYNAFWYNITHLKYDAYSNGMTVFRKNVSYILNNKDGYLYNVKLPDYLTYTGNLCVATQDGKYALLIWPNAFNDSFEYGVQIQDENNEVLSIMVGENMKALNSYYKDITDEYNSILIDLYEKAKSKWSI